jgi:hypothetical protein
MILIGLDVIAALKAHTFTLPNVSVKPAYTGTDPVCPMLVLKEQPSNDGVYLDGMPCAVRNVFTLEAYAQDMTIQDVPISKRDAAMKLIAEADALLNKDFMFTMIGPVQPAPYSDPTIFRAVANYFVYIDTRTNTLLRSIQR